MRFCVSQKLASSAGAITAVDAKYRYYCYYHLTVVTVLYGHCDPIDPSNEIHSVKISAISV